MMKKRNVVLSTFSGEVFEDIVDKLEEMEVDIIEKRYDLLYHRYEIYAKLTFLESSKLRRFIKHRDVNILEVGS